MTPREKLLRKMERKAEHLTDENYHEEAGRLFDLVRAVRAGKFNAVNTVFIPGNRVGDGKDYNFYYLDGEKIIDWLAKS